MKKPISIPLTDNPRTKQVELLPLKSINTLDNDKSHEDNSKDNTQSIQQLESDKRN